MTIDSLASVEGPIRSLLSPHGLEPGPLTYGNAGLTIAKYDLIDVDFDAPRETLDHPDTRARLRGASRAAMTS